MKTFFKRLFTIILSLLIACALIFIIAGLWPEKSLTTPAGYQQHWSTYITMNDGTRIAVRITLPEDIEENEQVPTIMETTRYGTEFSKTFIIKALVNLGIGKERTSKVTEMLLDEDYAVVKVDARGSGASFGSRKMEWSQEEIDDIGQVIDWIAAQPWSDGKVGSYGISYSGNTAELAMAVANEHLIASAPLYPDFNPIKQSAMPGGIFNETMIKAWSDSNVALDANEISLFNGGIKPVDEDHDGSLLAEALKERNNVNIYEAITTKTYFDEILANGYQLSALSPFTYKEEIEASDVPIYVRVGWQDAGTVNGAIERFLTYNNQQTLIIGPWSHAGYYFFDPFVPSLTSEEDIYNQRDTLETEQAQDLIDFFNHQMKTSDKDADTSQIQYYTLGEGVWKTTNIWPVVGFDDTIFYLDSEKSLNTTNPVQTTGEDYYKVDYSATTGTNNRWYTNVGGSMISYPDRSLEDKKLLTYTSEPLVNDIEITGVPLVTVNLSSNKEDGALYVYLEDVAPDGTVTYITEGQIRLLHRNETNNELGYTAIGPNRSFESNDGAFMVQGENTEICFEMYATSVLISKGHAIRIAIAGHDDANFRAFEGKRDSMDTILTIQRNNIHSSFITLPIKVRE